MAWIIDYNYGRPQNHNESYDYYVRLVRSTKSFDIYTANLEKIKPREGEILAAQKQWDVEALATEKQREIEVLEGEKRLKIEKQQREVEALAAKKQREVEAEHLKREAALSPQAM